MSRSRDLLPVGEVARMFGVDARTVTTWSKTGKFPPGSVQVTLGGHRRFRRDAVEALRRGQPWTGDDR